MAEPDTVNGDEQQLISDTGDLRKWRTEIPNLYDDADIDPLEFRLLVHYKRIGHRCTEGVRTTANKTHMSVGAVVEKRRKLADDGFVKLHTLEDTGKVIVEVIDMWEVNFLTYSQMSAARIERAAAGKSNKPGKKISPDPSQPVTQRPRSARDEVVDRLEKKFCAVTGIPAPGRATEAEKKAGGKLWWNPLWRIYTKLAGDDVDFAEEIIEITIQYMKAEHLSYIAPSSIENMAAYVVSEKGLTGGNHEEDRGSDDDELAVRISRRIKGSTGQAEGQGGA